MDDHHHTGLSERCLPCGGIRALLDRCDSGDLWSGCISCGLLSFVTWGRARSCRLPTKTTVAGELWGAVINPLFGCIELWLFFNLQKLWNERLYPAVYDHGIRRGAKNLHGSFPPPLLDIPVAFVLLFAQHYLPIIAKYQPFAGWIVAEKNSDRYFLFYRAWVLWISGVLLAAYCSGMSTISTR